MKKFIKLDNFEHLNFIKQDFNDYEILYLHQENIKEIYNQINSISLFATANKFLIIDQDHLFNQKINNDLKLFINALNQDSIMVIEKELHEQVLDYIENINIKEVDFDAQDIITTTINDLQLEVDEEALNLLLFNLDENESLIINELNKLSLLTNHITSEVVEQNSYKTQTAQAYDLVTLVINRQNNLANKIGKELLEQDFNQISLITFLQKQIALYYLVKLLLPKYKRTSIESLLNIHSFRLDHIIKAINNISDKQLAKIIIKLNEEEYRIKNNH